MWEWDLRDGSTWRETPFRPTPPPPPHSSYPPSSGGHPDSFPTGVPSCSGRVRVYYMHPPPSLFPPPTPLFAAHHGARASRSRLPKRCVCLPTYHFQPHASIRAKTDPWPPATALAALPALWVCEGDCSKPISGTNFISTDTKIVPVRK